MALFGTCRGGKSRKGQRHDRIYPYKTRTWHPPPPEPLLSDQWWISKVLASLSPGCLPPPCILPPAITERHVGERRELEGLVASQETTRACTRCRRHSMTPIGDAPDMEEAVEERRGACCLRDVGAAARAEGRGGVAEGLQAPILEIPGAMPTPRMRRRAIIIGGSMSGLFTAAFLRQIGWDVDVFERSPVELVGRGAGITSHPELLEALEASGAGTRDLGVSVSKRIAIDRDGRVIGERALAQILTSWDRLQRLLRVTIDPY